MVASDENYPLNTKIKTVFLLFFSITVSEYTQRNDNFFSFTFLFANKITHTKRALEKD